MLYLLIATVSALIASSLIAIAALFAAGYLYGQQKIMNKMAVEAKRVNARLTRDLTTWQSKLLEQSGAGPLHRRVFNDDTATPPKYRIVAPSRAISELKVEQQTGIKQVPKPKETVPVTIATEFLQDAGASLSAHSNE